MLAANDVRYIGMWEGATYRVQDGEPRTSVGAPRPNSHLKDGAHWPVATKGGG